MLLPMWKMVPVWMFLQLDFGVVDIKRLFLMLRSSIQMLQAITDRRFLLCTEILRRIKHEQRICEVEMASFTLLVFSTSGGMSGCMNIFYKRLAYLFSLKKS